ncbi:MAG TPA: hypothetical protein VFB21_03425, partial [Chthonomonadaceae bacterium]|nr:hypothetical protein [Chthonomonadaceae bacterium]
MYQTETAWEAGINHLVFDLRSVLSLLYVSPGARNTPGFFTTLFRDIVRLCRFYHCIGICATFSLPVGLWTGFPSGRSLS